jgi:Mg-chelatase subunit ChlD
MLIYSDFDKLEDALEINFYTSPIIEDTDGDGLTDFEEYNIGSNPADINSNGNEIVCKKFNSEEFGIEGEEVSASIILETSQKQIKSFTMEISDNAMLNENIPGYLGNAYDFYMDGTFQTAILSMNFKEDLLTDSTVVPSIYYYNEELHVLEKVKNQVRSGCTVSAELEHFSVYILLNETEYEKVWKQDIKKPSDDYANKNMDIVFVIDISYSMTWNDPEWVRRYVTKQFIEELSENDKASIVMFRKNTEILCGLTNNKIALTNSIDSLYNDDGYQSYSGTNGSLAINTALNLLNESVENTEKVIIFLTDGEDTEVSYNYNMLIETAKNSNTKIYTIGLGDSIDEAMLCKIATETQGKYYAASIASDLVSQYVEIKGETVDYWTDSNSDGISDYYTRLICDGKLVLGNGTNLFDGTSFEKVQLNNDYDNDGLTNGEELQVVNTGDKVYLKLLSDPTNKYSDIDLYDDYKEVKVFETNPQKNNLIYDYSDIYTITYDDCYMSHLYEDTYKDSVLQQSTIWIGNNVYGSNYSKVTMHKQVLLELFTEINGEQQEKHELEAAIEMGMDYIDTLKTVLENYQKYLKRVSDDVDYINNMNQQINNIQISIDELIASANTMSKQNFYSQIDELNNSLKNVINQSDELKELVDKSLVISPKTVKGLSNTVSKINVGLSVMEFGFSIKDAIDDYAILCGNLTTINENIYILEVITDHTSDDALKNAASDLLMSAQDLYNAKMDLIKQALKNMGETGLSMAIHTAITYLPVVGFWIELTLGITNIIVPIDDMAKRCYQIYGLGCVNEILSDDFKKSIIASFQVTKDNKFLYATYDDEVEELNNKYINLVTLRIFSEEKMVEMEETTPEWLNWFYDLLSSERTYIVAFCKDNIEFLKEIQYKYIVTFK